MGKRTKQNETTRAQQMIAGMEKHFANVPSLTFASATHTTAEVTSGLQTLVSLRKAVDDAKAVVKAKIAAEEAQAPALLELLNDLASFVKATFARRPGRLRPAAEEATDAADGRPAGGRQGQARRHAQGQGNHRVAQAKEREGRRDGRHHHADRWRGQARGVPERPRDACQRRRHDGGLELALLARVERGRLQSDGGGPGGRGFTRGAPSRAARPHEPGPASSCAPCGSRRRGSGCARGRAP